MDGSLGAKVRLLLKRCYFFFFAALFGSFVSAAGAASLRPIVVNCIFGDSPKASIRGKVGDTVVIRVVGGVCKSVEATKGRIKGAKTISQSSPETYTLASGGSGSIFMVSLMHEKVITIPFVVVGDRWRDGNLNF